MAESHPSPEPPDDFVGLIARYHRELYVFVRMICRHRSDVDDVFQEVLTVVWRRAETFQAGTDFMAWACQIARFVSLDYARRRGRAIVNLDPVLIDELGQMVAARATHAEDRIAALRHCVDRLSPSHRSLIEHRYVEGTAVQSIAKATGRSDNSISVTLHGIRKGLEKCIRARMTQDGAV